MFMFLACVFERTNNQMLDPGSVTKDGVIGILGVLCEGECALSDVAVPGWR